MLYLLLALYFIGRWGDVKAVKADDGWRIYLAQPRRLLHTCIGLALIYGAFWLLLFLAFYLLMYLQ